MMPLPPSRAARVGCSLVAALRTFFELLDEWDQKENTDDD